MFDIHTMEPLSKEEIEKRRNGHIQLFTYVGEVIETSSFHVDKRELNHYVSFDVPYLWAEKKAKEQGFNNLQEFLGEYTWDNTVGWMPSAQIEGVLIHCHVNGLTGLELSKIAKFPIPFTDDLTITDDDLPF